ncbi:MAG: hypothetical protein MK020_04995 [Dehalococcoidia bacterium]|nr:hypothetical protein [Dehalococcoidia bacterium]
MRQIYAVVMGLCLSFFPSVILAGSESRSLDPSVDLQVVIFWTILTLAGLGIVMSLGYLYRRERDLNWDFQKPDVPHDDHH